MGLPNQVLSRRVNLQAGESQDVLDFHRPGEIWRLSVQELESTSALRVTVKTGFANSEEKIVFLVAPGSAVEYGGCHSATIEVEAVQNNSSADVQLSPMIPGQFLLDRDESGQQINNAAWTDLGTNGGHPQPYMNYAAIMTSGTVDIRTVAAGGGVFFEALGLAPQTLLLNQFRIGNFDRLQARGAGAANQNIRVIWYNRR
jgi:hypothetical protein